MADDNAVTSPPTGAPTATTVQPPGAPDAGSGGAGSPTPPTSQTPALPADYETHKANSQRWDQFSPVIGRLREVGITDRSHLDAALGPVLKARDLGIDLAQAINGLANNTDPSTPAATPDRQQSLTIDDVARLMDQRDQKATLTQQHKAAFETEDSAVAAAAKELAGGRDGLERLIAPLVREEISNLNPTYPFGHPLEGKPRAATADEIAQIKQALMSDVHELVGGLIAGGGAPNGPSTPAGAGGDSGNPPPAKTSGGLPSREQMLQDARAYRQASGHSAGQPMSTAV